MNMNVMKKDKSGYLNITLNQHWAGQWENNFYIKVDVIPQSYDDYRNLNYETWLYSLK